LVASIEATMTGFLNWTPQNCVARFAIISSRTHAP
jgi:hypothetical protein